MSSPATACSSSPAPASGSPPRPPPPSSPAPSPTRSPSPAAAAVTPTTPSPRTSPTSPPPRGWRPPGQDPRRWKGQCHRQLLMRRREGLAAVRAVPHIPALGWGDARIGGRAVRVLVAGGDGADQEVQPRDGRGLREGDCVHPGERSKWKLPPSEIRALFFSSVSSCVSMLRLSRSKVV
ncbi:hypothetical protein DAI22_09g054600 [Oryza sativa Japonica Group]|nr:hypothetical protein DAI22_09g054600 [Oryza sativa Japonica Group]